MYMYNIICPAIPISVKTLMFFFYYLLCMNMHVCTLYYSASVIYIQYYVYINQKENDIISNVYCKLAHNQRFTYTHVCTMYVY